MANHGYYEYQPNTSAAGVFAVLFAIPTLYHCYQCFRTRTWFLIPLIIGGICASRLPSISPSSTFPIPIVSQTSPPVEPKKKEEENQTLTPTPVEVVGYAARVVSSHHLLSMGPYVVQMLLILLAPSLVAASLYMLLGRLMPLVPNGAAHALIAPRFLTKLFVVGDVASFLLQCMGGGITAAGALGSNPDPDKVTLGRNIIKIGLFVQVLFFAFFLVVGSWWKRGVEKEGRVGVAGVPWRKHFWVLMGASGLVFVRCVFRVIEYLSGQDGALLTHEWYAYVFDAVLILGVVILYNVVHPSEVLGESKEKSIDGPGMEMA